ncbi:hypothetical protein Tco_1247477 [Tanacetum coccineum]
MRQRRWIELLSDYDCEIRYHTRGKQNLRTDALSRKERTNLRVRPWYAIGLFLSITNPKAQKEAVKIENIEAEDIGDMLKKLEPALMEMNVWIIEVVTMLCRSLRLGHCLIRPLPRSAHFFAMKERMRREINEVVTWKGNSSKTWYYRAIFSIVIAISLQEFATCMKALGTQLNLSTAYQSSDHVITRALKLHRSKRFTVESAVRLFVGLKLEKHNSPDQRLFMRLRRRSLRLEIACKRHVIDKKVMLTRGVDLLNLKLEILEARSTLGNAKTSVEFFSDEDELEIDLGNITNSYTVPTTPNTRIHKDYPIENVIGDVKSSV